MNLETPLDSEVADLNVQVRQVRGNPNSGPPEISSPGRASAVQTPAEPASPVGVDSATQDRFNMAVAACREASAESFFRNRKLKLLDKLDAAYTIYQVVKLNPALEEQLYKIDLLQDRTRKLSKKKLALACTYCALQPRNEDDLKACSDYTAYLLEAEAKKTSPDDFAQWAKLMTIKACLKAVRARKRAGTAGDQDRRPSVTADLRLSITRNAKGVRGSMDGRAFQLTQATLDAIVDLIKTPPRPRPTRATNRTCCGDPWLRRLGGAP